MKRGITIVVFILLSFSVYSKCDCAECEIAVLEEKTESIDKSINKRFDDFHVYGTIIIVLLAGTTVFSAVRANRIAREASKKQFDEAFGSFKTEIENIKQEAEVLVGGLRTEYELVQEKKKQEKDTEDNDGS